MPEELQQEQEVPVAQQQPPVEGAPPAEKPVDGAPAEPKSVREAVEAAWEKVEQDAAPPDDGAAPKVPVRDPATGKFQAAPKAADKKTGLAPVRVQPGAARSAPLGAPGAPVSPAEGPRAPQSWKAPVREHWAKLPREVQEEVVRREKEMTARLEQDAPVRVYAEGWRRTLAPFEQNIRAAGAEPAAVVTDLLRTAHQLATAPAWHKAVVTANIIKGYGVDVGMLADALDGAQGPGGQPPEALAVARDPRVDRLEQAFQQREQQYAATIREQEARDLASLEAGYAKFAETHEFFEDVRNDMAAIVRLKADEGVDISDEDAYTMGLALHPELMQLAQQKAEAARAANPDGSTRRAAAAAASLRPAGAPRSQVVEAKNLRGVIEAAFDKHSGQA